MTIARAVAHRRLLGATVALCFLYAGTSAAWPSAAHAEEPQAGAADVTDGGDAKGAGLTPPKTTGRESGPGDDTALLPPWTGTAEDSVEGDPAPLLATLRQAARALAMVEPERARSLISRARLAPWLPEIRIRVDREFGRTEAIDDNATSLLDTTPLPVDLDTVNEVRYEWRATWDLSRIVFNPDELSAHSEAMRMADARREIESLVIRLYFERERLWRAETHGDGRPRDHAKRLQRLEIEAQLDALTDGAYSRVAHAPMHPEPHP